MIALGTLLLLQPWQTIKTVDVQSTLIPSEKIEQYAGIYPNTPSWKVTGQTQFIAQKIIKHDDKIDTAKVTQEGRQVTIDIVEKVTAGYIQKNKQWYVINRNGVQNKVQSPEGNAPIYAGFSNQADVKMVVAEFVKLELTLRQNISQINFSPNKDNANRLLIIMNDGNTVYATLGTFGKKISYYPGIAAQMPSKGVVDLQFGAYSYAYGTSHANVTKKKADNKAHQK
ncbi:cell division protein FtsQ/DivIB [Leuconostoc rapi]